MLKLVVLMAPLLFLASAAPPHPRFRLGVFSVKAGLTNEQLCILDLFLEGKVLLSGDSKCCHGQVVCLGDTCPEDTNPEVTFASSEDRRMIVCDFAQSGSVIAVKNSLDVSRVIRVMRRFKQQFSLRSGGHSSLCTNTCDGCVTISFELMKAIAWKYPSSEKAVMIVEPGVTIGEAFHSYTQTDYMIIHGVSGPIGLGGHLSGGGLGYLVRKHGLGTDLVYGAEVVLATGKIVKVFERKNGKGAYQDLLWALRGSNHNNFGVVTKFWLKTLRRPKYMVVGVARFAINSADDLKNFWGATCAYYSQPTDPAHDSVNLDARPQLLPITDPGFVPTLRFALHYTPDNSDSAEAAYDEAEAAINHFLTFVDGTPISVEYNAVPHSEFYEGQMLPTTNREAGTCSGKQVLTRESLCDNQEWLDKFAAMAFEETKLENWLFAEAPRHFYLAFEMWGGAGYSNDPNSERTSVGVRDSWGTTQFCVWPLAPQPRDVLDARVRHYDDVLWRSISNTTYFNYADLMATGVREFFPDDSMYKKLQAVKTKYDATNVFQHAFSIEQKNN